MAKISAIKQAIAVLRNARVTPFIWGNRGLGKSSLVRQYCKEMGMGFIDLRCSQLEASDIRGLPDAVGGQTRYLPPADLPTADMEDEQIIAEMQKHKVGTDDFERTLTNLQPRFKKGILFLDELNRAADDVLQAAFQLVLDNRVGQYVLPQGWSVVAAGNFMEGYQVSGFNDPAFINRFCHLTLDDGESTVEEWVQYMAESHGADAMSVIEFASQNTKHLDGDIKAELGFKVMPSRRSWDSVARVDKYCNENGYSSDIRQMVIAGLVGMEMANAYVHYNCPVKPKDLLEKGVKPYESKLKDLSRGQLVGLSFGLVSYTKGKLDDDKISDVCLDYAEFLLNHSDDKDIVVAFCKSLASGTDQKEDKLRAAVLSNPELAKMMANFRSKSVSTGKLKKEFVDRLVERPSLQKVLSRVSWGASDATPAKK